MHSFVARVLGIPTRTGHRVLGVVRTDIGGMAEREVPDAARRFGQDGGCTRDMPRTRIGEDPPSFEVVDELSRLVQRRREVIVVAHGVQLLKASEEQLVAGGRSHERGPTERGRGLWVCGEFPGKTDGTTHRCREIRSQRPETPQQRRSARPSRHHGEYGAQAADASRRTEARLPSDVGPPRALGRGPARRRGLTRRVRDRRPWRPRPSRVVFPRGRCARGA